MTLPLDACGDHCSPCDSVRACKHQLVCDHLYWRSSCRSCRGISPMARWWSSGTTASAVCVWSTTLSHGCRTWTIRAWIPAHKLLLEAATATSETSAKAAAVNVVYMVGFLPCRMTLSGSMAGCSGLKSVTIALHLYGFLHQLAYPPAGSASRRC